MIRTRLTLAAARHLLRQWKSVPLPKVTQGSTLEIRSLLSQTPTHVLIQPEWREDAHAELKQVFEKKNQTFDQQRQPLVNLVVNYKGESETSIGREEPHLILTLDQDSTTTETTGETNNTQQDDKDSIIHSLSSHKKSVDKVILDDGTILPDSPKFEASKLDGSGSRRVEYHDGIAHITKDSEGNEYPGTYLTIKVPEKVNLICDLRCDTSGSDSSSSGGSISIDSKIEGDVKLYTTNGDIRVTKLRGHNIDLRVNGRGKEEDNRLSTIYVRDLLEAEKIVVETTGRVRAKQMHAQNIQITVKPETAQSATTLVENDTDDDGSLVDISSMYVSGQGGATVNVTGPCQLTRRAVRIKSNHGPINVRTTGMTQPTETNQFLYNIYPVIELGGVNGNCEVAMEHTTTNSAAESTGDNDSWSSCLVHFDSLALESVSLVTVDQGNTSLTVDRKVETDLRLASLANEDTLVETGAMLAEEEDDHLIMNILQHTELDPSKANSKALSSSRISIQTDAYTQRGSTFKSDALEYMDGWVVNKSNEPDSRFERKLHGADESSSSVNTGVGKINIKSAAVQALKRFDKMADHGSSGGGNSIEERDDEMDIHHIGEDHRPLVVVVGTGQIILESVSWFGAIARRYGMEDYRREPGRTAGRRGRNLSPDDE